MSLNVNLDSVCESFKANLADARKDAAVGEALHDAKTYLSQHSISGEAIIRKMVDVLLQTHECGKNMTLRLAAVRGELNDATAQLFSNRNATKGLEHALERLNSTNNLLKQANSALATESNARRDTILAMEKKLANLEEQLAFVRNDNVTKPEEPEIEADSTQKVNIKVMVSSDQPIPPELNAKIDEIVHQLNNL